MPIFPEYRFTGCSEEEEWEEREEEAHEEALGYACVCGGASGEGSARGKGGAG
jgi:hypothetical protein